MERKTYIITNEIGMEFGAFPTYKGAKRYIQNILENGNYHVTEQTVNVTTMYTNEEIESTVNNLNCLPEEVAKIAECYNCSEELINLTNELSDFYFKKGMFS